MPWRRPSRCYRFLFDCVAEFFAELLASNLEQLAPGGKRRKIGLAAKWCPTPGSSFDQTTLLCEAIARRLFPRDSSPDYAQLSEEHYGYSVLRRLRREALVPLRDVLQLTELPYTRVASVAMRRYKALFKKHDEDRFAQYLADVEEGKAKIACRYWSLLVINSNKFFVFRSRLGKCSMAGPSYSVEKMITPDYLSTRTEGEPSENISSGSDYDDMLVLKRKLKSLKRKYLDLSESFENAKKSHAVVIESTKHGAVGLPFKSILEHHTHSPSFDMVRNEIVSALYHFHGPFS
uniref:DUF2828 domain-containing protein n=1 Tax=Oryza punctata TaxID=4537 RepID=A0A0E0MFQ6_ORYPU